ncbi:serine/threonine kinase-like domain-containing protein STKLD1 [Liolophura sinensis]|uniref:serine/threonine kinase-like domain-containing protein STKLD1 n=1 Tax=Liolophura sinensis TaxID=3198878 RepID=UPI0031584057
MDQYRILERLGKGGQGSVYLVENRIECKKYVLKKVECKDEGEANNAFREASTLKGLQHPYVCGFKEFFVAWDKEDSAIYFCMIIEHYPQGDLSSVLRMKRNKRETVDETLLKKWLGQMVDALLYVHRKGIVHRDIKPSNLFLKDSMDLCLGDFGVATVMNDARSNTRAVVGTLTYLAPELCVDETSDWYSEQSDLWSVGCVLLELTTCSLLDQQQVLSHLTDLRSQESMVLDNLQKDVTELYNPELMSVLRLLLNRDPRQRPVVSKLLSVQYIRDCVDMVDTNLIDKRKKQASAGLNRNPMPRGQGVAAVLSYLRTVLNNKDKVRDSLEYLLELSMEDRISVDPVSKLLTTEAMVNNLTERDVQLAGLGLFNRLVITAEAGDIIFSEDIVSAIPKIIQAHADCPELQQSGSDLLMALSAHEKAAEMIGIQGGVKHLLTALRSFGDNAELCASCCNALWSLSVVESNSKRLSDLSGLEIVCQTLRTHMNSSDVVEATAACLLSLSMEDDSLRYIGELETVTLLVRAVDAHANNAKVVKNSCLALASFVELDEESAFKVLAYESRRSQEVAGLPILVGAYNVHKDNAEVVEAICTVLMELAMYDEIKAEMNFLKFGQTMLAEIQKRFKENKDIMGPCEATIQALGPSPAGKNVSLTSLAFPEELTKAKAATAVQ